MPEVTQHDLQKHMHVYSADNATIGQVSELYEDSFAVHKGLLGKHLYFPYSTVSSLEGDKILLKLSHDETEQPLWQKRPDYEDHPGDPTQLFYDRGHGIQDPFDETNPDKI
jgi:hypothetical protein